jgi:hypothetical protein
MVEGTFHESTIVSKSGIKHIVYWNQKGGFLYESGGVAEYELMGMTNRGKKFTGTGVYLTDRIHERTWLAKVIDVEPVHSRGWHPVDGK